MEDMEVRKSVWELLSNMNGLDPLKQLFWTELNYERINTPLSRHDWPERANKALTEDPVLFAGYGDFHIIYSRLSSDRLLLGLERPVVNHLIREHDRALFVFSDNEQKNWHFVNAKYAASVEGRAKRRILRRITIGPDERLRTAAERIATLDMNEMPRDLLGLSALNIQQQHDEAFDVEKVTKAFFADYTSLFKKIQNQLFTQTRDQEWSHDYALQLLNRMMFLYFIQRKRWIGDDPNFILNFWKAYKDSEQPKDTFFPGWLETLFFEAFNNRFQAGRSDKVHIPGNIRSVLSGAPYLNGGLFSRNDLDDKYSFEAPDAIFRMLFDQFGNRSRGFLEAYNFTIREDSPFDQEVAVDPEMIGKVYESLVNATFEDREEDLRGTAGIFYTPRVEIDLMCRLSLVDWLTNHLGEEHKPRIYEIVFAYDPDEQRQADEAFSKENLWDDLSMLLREITVLDPACGSGSFLVGMLTVLDDLQNRADERLGIEETPYQRRKRIIGQSLYGVDVMPWAVHVAELRLWLQLVVETELKMEELQFKPVLPNLSFKIRPGDSLVQEVGGINLALHRSHPDIPSQLKRRLTLLKGDKLKFYRGNAETKLGSEAVLKTEERALFRDILHEKRANVEKQIKTLTSQIESPLEQLTLSGIRQDEAVQLDLQVEGWKSERDDLQKGLNHVEKACDALRDAKEPPFIWDLAFVEIFEGDKNGFDIVLGNPPYVRQEKIAEPGLKEENFSADEWRRIKKEYKGKLQFSVATTYPDFFQYNPSTGSFRKIDSKSDLYVYFYLHGLSLLNPKGAFCFITSNSWLDVGYGKDLQEFLLKNCRVRMIIDNQAKRSFAQSDVNTIIALVSAPNRGAGNLDNIARFSMFKLPFENALSPVFFEEIEEAKERTSWQEHRVHPISQRDLLVEGVAIPNDADHTLSLQTREYAGNKWGGKYLRAPDIFFKILEKGEGKLVKLGDIADVRRGVTTGANEFFYLDQEKIDVWGVEEEFLKPVIKSPRECKSILINPDDLKYSILMCHEEKEDLWGTNVLDYIEWGEEKGFHERPSCRTRARWWDLGERLEPRLIFNYLISSTAKTLYSIQGCYASDNFQEIHFTGNAAALNVSLNSSLFQLFVNTMGRSNFGGGLLKVQTYEVAGLLCLDPACISYASDLNALLSDEHWDTLQVSGARHALDRIVFDGLELDEYERSEVYEAVCELVGNRLKKARSV